MGVARQDAPTPALLANALERVAEDDGVGLVGDHIPAVPGQLSGGGTQDPVVDDLRRAHRRIDVGCRRADDAVARQAIRRARRIR